jgi:CBS domain-containing protein
MRIADVLERKGSSVATVPGDATVGDAAAELARLSIGALVVSPDGMHIEGIVSERDIVRQLPTRGADLLSRTVSTIMSVDVHTCTLDDSIETLMAMMTDRRVRHVPVVRDGVLCGMISIGDVVKQRIGELEQDRKELVEYITAR